MTTLEDKPAGTITASELRRDVKFESLEEYEPVLSERDEKRPGS